MLAPWNLLSGRSSQRICNFGFSLMCCPCHDVCGVMSHRRHGASNHWKLGCFCNSSFRLASRKLSIPASLDFVMRIHQWLIVSSHKVPIMRKTFQCHDVSCRQTTIHAYICASFSLHARSMRITGTNIVCHMIHNLDGTAFGWNNLTSLQN